MLRSRALAYFALVLATFIWGINFIVVKQGIDAWGGQKFAFLAARFWLAFLVFAIIVCVRFVNARRKASDSSLLPERRVKYQALLVGVVLAVGYGSQTWYLQVRSAVSASFLTSTTVLWAALIAKFVLRERVSRSTMIGALIAFTGIILIEAPVGSWQFEWVSFFGLLAAVAFAVEILLVSRFAPVDQSMQWTMISCFSVALLMSIVALVANWQIWTHGPRDSEEILSTSLRTIFTTVKTPSMMFAVIFTGIFATAVALGLQNWAQAQRIGDQRIIDGPRAAILSTLEPVFTTLAAGILILLNLKTPKPPALVALGCFLILCGTLLSELAAAKHRQKTEPDSYHVEKSS
jgi:drug/metabolite transporter (DMT)-like permease